MWTPEAREKYKRENREYILEQSRQYARRRYKLEPEKVKASYRKSMERLNDVVYKAKDNPCLDFGKTFPSCAMQFDHVRGEKLNDIAVLRTRGSLQKLQEEIAKCDLVCANCHAIRTCIRDTRPKSRRCTHE